MRRQVARVDGGGDAALLQEARGRQPDGAAAEDGGALVTGAQHLGDGELGGAPRQRDAAAAVAVVVDDELVAELLGAHDVAAGAERAQADDGAHDAVARDVHGHEVQLARRLLAGRLRAGDAREQAGAGERAHRAQHDPPRHIPHAVIVVDHVPVRENAVESRSVSGRVVRVALLLLVLAALALAYRAGLFARLSAPRELAAALVARGAWGYLAFIVAYALLQPFGVPGTVFIVAAPLIWPWPIAFALSMTGTMAASVIGFSFARFVARDFVAARIPARFRKYDEAVERHAFRTVFLLRLIFWMPQLLHAFLGVSKVPFWTHFWASLLGYLPPIFLVSYIGSEIFDASGHMQPRAWLMLGALVSASLLLAFILQRRDARRAPHGAAGDCWRLFETAGSSARAARASRRIRLRPGGDGRPRPSRRRAHRSSGPSRIRRRRVEDADGRRHDLSYGLDDEADRRRMCDDARRG